MKKVSILNLVTIGLLFIAGALLLLHKDRIVTIYQKYFAKKSEGSVLVKNEYFRDYDFMFVKNTTDFSPKNLQHLYDIYYTVINSGMTEFTFYCPDEYSECIHDVLSIANNQTLLSHINNFVHPFNGFKHIETKYDSFGKVTISIVKSYSEEERKAVEIAIAKIKNTLIVPSDSLENNIKRIHDYIISNTKYDSDRSDSGIIKYKSDIAYGPLLEGYALCGGYTDTMELFLEILGVKSYKISSESHVWNAVYINNEWKHLDLTWDDPVSLSGVDLLQYDFYFVDTNSLQQSEKEQHQFDKTIYLEFQ